MSNQKDTCLNCILGILIGLCILSAIIAICLYCITLGTTRSTLNADWGTFGDYFSGLLNPIINIVTLIFVAFTVHYTRMTYDKQNEELTEYKKNEPKARCFEFLHIWHGEHLISRRVAAWEFVQKECADLVNGNNLPLYFWRDGGHPDKPQVNYREIYNNISLVFHFFADVYKIISIESKDRIIDSDVMERLFKDEFSAWYEKWKIIDFANYNNKLKASEIKIIEWHNKYIHALAQLWCLAQPSDTKPIVGSA
jgi:uncharacterized membrane protein